MTTPTQEAEELSLQAPRLPEDIEGEKSAPFYLKDDIVKMDFPVLTYDADKSEQESDEKETWECGSCNQHKQLSSTAQDKESLSTSCWSITCNGKMRMFNRTSKDQINSSDAEPAQETNGQEESAEEPQQESEKTDDPKEKKDTSITGLNPKAVPYEPTFDKTPDSSWGMAWNKSGGQPLQPHYAGHPRNSGSVPRSGYALYCYLYSRACLPNNITSTITI